MTSSGMEDVRGSRVLTAPAACLKARREGEKGSARPPVLKRFSPSHLLWLHFGCPSPGEQRAWSNRLFGGWRATDDLLHRDLPQRRRVPARVPPAGLPRAPPYRGKAPRLGLAPRGGGRVLLPPPRHARRAHPQGHR